MAVAVAGGRVVSCTLPCMGGGSSGVGQRGSGSTDGVGQRADDAGMAGMGQRGSGSTDDAVLQQ